MNLSSWNWSAIVPSAIALGSLAINLRHYLVDRHRIKLVASLSHCYAASSGERLAIKIEATNISKRVVRICEVGIEIREPGQRKALRFQTIFSTKDGVEPVSLDDGQTHAFCLDPYPDDWARELHDTEIAYAKATQGRVYRVKLWTTTRNYRIGAPPPGTIAVKVPESVSSPERLLLPARIESYISSLPRSPNAAIPPSSSNYQRLQTPNA